MNNLKNIDTLSFERLSRDVSKLSSERIFKPINKYIKSIGTNAVINVNKNILLGDTELYITTKTFKSSLEMFLLDDFNMLDYPRLKPYKIKSLEKGLKFRNNSDGTIDDYLEGYDNYIFYKQSIDILSDGLRTLNGRIKGMELNKNELVFIKELNSNIRRLSQIIGKYMHLLSLEIFKARKNIEDLYIRNKNHSGEELMRMFNLKNYKSEELDDLLENTISLLDSNIYFNRGRSETLELSLRESVILEWSVESWNNEYNSLLEHSYSNLHDMYYNRMSKHSLDLQNLYYNLFSLSNETTLYINYNDGSTNRLLNTLKLISDKLDDVEREVLDDSHQTKIDGLSELESMSDESLNIIRNLETFKEHHLVIKVKEFLKKILNLMNVALGVLDKLKSNFISKAVEYNHAPVDNPNDLKIIYLNNEVQNKLYQRMFQFMVEMENYYNNFINDLKLEMNHYGIELKPKFDSDIAGESILERGDFLVDETELIMNNIIEGFQDIEERNSKDLSEDEKLLEMDIEFFDSLIYGR